MAIHMLPGNDYMNRITDVAMADAIVDTKTAPKVTRDSILAAIDHTQYVFFDTLTIAIVYMRNGFKVVGKSACASPENFDEDVGRTYAFEDAVKQLWVLEGYLLCQRLADKRDKYLGTMNTWPDMVIPLKL